MAAVRRGPSAVGLILTLGCILIQPPALAVEKASVRKAEPRPADSGRAARRSAMAGIPLDELDPGARAKVESIVSRGNIFRRLPTRTVPCDPEMYLFLVEHPDVVVNIWQVLGISRMTMQQIDQDRFRVTDGGGTVGTLEFLYHSHDTHLIYSEGSYKGPLFNRPVRGRSLLVLNSAYVREPDGRYYVTSRMDVFTRVEHLGVELLGKTFQPLVGRVADVNFTQTVGFLGSLSRTAEVNLRGVQRLAESLSKVQPDVRTGFAEMAVRVASKAPAPSEAGLAKDPGPTVR